MKTSTYIIFDATFDRNHFPICRVEAEDGKSALEVFLRLHLMSSCLYEIHRSRAFWEMTSRFGNRFYAVKEV